MFMFQSNLRILVYFLASAQNNRRDSAMKDTAGAKVLTKTPLKILMLEDAPEDAELERLEMEDACLKIIRNPNFCFSQ